MSSPVTPFFWFDTQAEEAAQFYVDLFEDSRIVAVSRYAPDTPGEEGTVMTVDFVLRGTSFTALNGGPMFEHTQATSFVVRCETQPEIDHFWDAFLDGGIPSQCGWITDRFGVTWQVVPEHLGDWIGGPDEAGRNRAMQAMLAMVKLDIPVLQSAYDGTASSA
jgi:predicted 3-demethylubiquinone-9 3-methyltransferase (glyoxalase superfamily)